MGKKIIRKVFVNKNNKQLNVSLSKKQLKSIYPTMKFNEDLFVRLELFSKGKKKNG